MITPFRPQLHRGDGHTQLISCGLSSFGYDLTLSPDDFRIFRRVPGTVVDPKHFTGSHLETSKLITLISGERFFVLPAHSYALGVSTERLHMPPDVVGVCVGKSTYARCGVICNVTPLEPGWKGHLTIEISNSSDSDVRVYANEGIAQVLFHQGATPQTTYADRSGKYQDQRHEVTLARL
jgi:dCTP deaminase